METACNCFRSKKSEEEDIALLSETVKRVHHIIQNGRRTFLLPGRKRKSMKNCSQWKQRRVRRASDNQCGNLSVRQSTCLRVLTSGYVNLLESAFYYLLYCGINRYLEMYRGKWL